MKFHLHFTAFLLLINYQFILCEDWSHSSADYHDDGEEEGGESDSAGHQKETKNLQIGVVLPWVKTSRLRLSAISQSFLVPIVINSKRAAKTTYFCRVEVQKGVKVVGQLHYDKQECTIPSQLPPTVLTGQIASLKTWSELKAVPTSGQWPVFEVLTNPRQLVLAPVHVKLRQGESVDEARDYMPARPILADLPRGKVRISKMRRRYPPPFLAFFFRRDSGYKYYAGVVQEVTQNGTLAFYYGLYNVPRAATTSQVYVMAVLSTQLSPRSLIG